MTLATIPADPNTLYALKDFIGDSVLLLAMTIGLCGLIVLMWAWAKFIAPQRQTIERAKADRAQAESVAAQAVKDTALILVPLVKDMKEASEQMKSNLDRMKV